jgi:hypothetical protein
MRQGRVFNLVRKKRRTKTKQSGEGKKRRVPGLRAGRDSREIPGNSQQKNGRHDI